MNNTIRKGPYPLMITKHDDAFVIISDHATHYATTYDPSAARLIAAAPDLLSALERLANDYAALMNSQGAAIDIGQPGSEFTAGQWVGARLGSPVHEAWKAIAKAKGEA
jgi:hypothetical protein